MTAEDRTVSEPVAARVDLPGVDLPTYRLTGHSPTWLPEALLQPELEVQQAALASAGPVPGGRARQTVGGSDGRGTGTQIIGQAAPRPGALPRARPAPGCQSGRACKAPSCLTEARLPVPLAVSFLWGPAAVSARPLRQAPPHKAAPARAVHLIQSAPPAGSFAQTKYADVKQLQVQIRESPVRYSGWSS